MHAWQTLRALPQRWQQFWLLRHAPSDHIQLTQRNVYILPTAAGWMLALTLLTLLLASINYQLNLGYLLTFLLTGSAVVGLYQCHGTLRGLRLHLHLQLPAPQFAQQPMALAIHLHNPDRRTRYGIGLSLWGPAPQWHWTDVPAQGHAQVPLAWLPARRGLHALPALRAQTHFPLGTFRAWTLWRPASQVLVYPAPETPCPPLPSSALHGGTASHSTTSQGAEFDGVRAYRRGDPRKHILWKKLAKADELLSRDTQASGTHTLWLDAAHTGVAPSQKEAQLSRLCAWVLQAEKQQQPYGLRLGTLEIAPALGETHQHQCLQALALYA